MKKLKTIEARINLLEDRWNSVIGDACCITFDDAENAPIDLIVGVNRAFAMDAINAESIALIGSEDLGTVTGLSCTTTSTPMNIPTGWSECNGGEAQIGEIVFANGSVIYTNSEEPIPYRITGEVTNIITA